METSNFLSRCKAWLEDSGDLDLSDIEDCINKCETKLKRMKGEVPHDQAGIKDVADTISFLKVELDRLMGKEFKKPATNESCYTISEYRFDPSPLVPPSTNEGDPIFLTKEDKIKAIEKIKMLPSMKRITSVELEAIRGRS